MDPTSTRTLESLIARYGIDAIKDEIKQLDPGNRRGDELTIISNQNLHKVPDDQIFGELYIASTGNLHLDTKEILIKELVDILSDLRTKLHEKSWKKIYLHYTGPQILGSAIKHFVYRTIGMETVDFVYTNGSYIQISLDYRNIK